MSGRTLYKYNHGAKIITTFCRLGDMNWELIAHGREAVTMCDELFEGGKIEELNGTESEGFGEDNTSTCYYLWVAGKPFRNEKEGK